MKDVEPSIQEYIVSAVKPIHIGKVVWFNNSKAFGFISYEIDGVKQNDMFVHQTDIDGEGYRTLAKDMEVEFEIGFNFNGKPKATKVRKR